MQNVMKLGHNKRSADLPESSRPPIRYISVQAPECCKPWFPCMRTAIEMSSCAGSIGNGNVVLSCLSLEMLSISFHLVSKTQTALCGVRGTV